MSKVVKFGGSSLADAKQFRKVADIIHADPERKYVVPSAPGKRFTEDTKVTDMLYRCYSSTPHALSSSTTRAISTLTSPTHASARSLTRPRRR